MLLKGDLHICEWNINKMEMKVAEMHEGALLAQHSSTPPEFPKSTRPSSDKFAKFQVQVRDLITAFKYFKCN